MTGAKPCSTSMAPGAHSILGDPHPNSTKYKSIARALQNCTLTRLEIAFIMNQLYKYMHTPTSDHWSTTKIMSTLPQRYSSQWFGV